MKTKLEFISTVFIVKKEKVLLLFNKKLNNWTPPGGHIEHGETPCKSVIREAKEETGYDIEILGNKQGPTFLNKPEAIHFDELPEDWNHHHLNIIYFAKIIGGKQKKFTDEGWRMKWFTKEELEKQEMFPNVKMLAMQAINQQS